jgi:hypothetical protein
MSDTPSELLLRWILRRLTASSKTWFEDQLSKLNTNLEKKAFDIAFAMVPRKLGKDDLALNSNDLFAANASRAGWDPSNWSLDVAARVYLLIDVSNDTIVPFPVRFKELHRTADLGELLALYGGLPLYARPEELIALTADGLRTNIKAEFQAIAHQNPFPAEQFDENPWNNMILKALFIGVMLEPIQGIDKRANPELARVLIDYAHERWAAGRFVSPELWRCIGPFVDDIFLDDFQRVIDQGNETEKKAVALALVSAQQSEHKTKLCAQLAEYDDDLMQKKITWATIANEMFVNSLAVTSKMNFEVELKK